ncbi:thioredoxin-disulfide reductase [Candidatus Karelsulcia muelleri]|uniref:thioredoxin-disulfide reductase n=1 Tax=Candidatus Karelsulcia muelleri TaxID=336810 RepID=UPI00236390F6|nr:thioredoxin-disulfide reductase [Candidatus Karelsulcia muelleri]WDE42273.1 thioredoxin-disulfide reductase [Candidatus Karelsulcia muelleri]WDR79122.1 thioredoxin-disulfide reductase [Candidatus Karelsulcia muelleri]
MSSRVLGQIFDCIIIGGGPAGYTAAIYLARAEIKHILFTGFQPGGQLISTKKIENYPGFKDGISGYNLMESFKAQSEKFGTQVKYNSVVKIKINRKPKVMNMHETVLDNSLKIKTKAIIIATGANTRYLNIENEKKLIGKGLYTCANCDGYFFKEKKVAVIGGGDKAAEESIYLSNICKKVYIIIRDNKMKASKILQKQVVNINNVEIFYNHKVRKLIGKQKLQAIYCKNRTNNRTYLFHVEAIFLAIGQIPNTLICKPNIKLDKDGYIITKSTITNIPGIFAAGDVQDSSYRQAITSAASGCISAIEVEKYLRTEVE